MRRPSFATVLAILFWGEFIGCGIAKTLDYSAYPDSSNNFAEASFSCTVPVGSPQAILFLAGGTDSDARPWLNDSRWQMLAEREHLILIAACLRGAGESYEVASGGSGQALLSAIGAFATQSGHPEMKRLPLILYGHSAGAQFAFNFACWKPAMVRAIVEVKSGPLFAPSFPEPPTFRALFIVGERDLPGRVREVAKAFAAGRSLGAPWCLAYQPNAGHDAQGCRDLAEAFIRTIDSTTVGNGGYAELSRPDRPLAALGATDANYSWLPGPAFFPVWRGFVRDASLSRLVSLPDELPQERISWQPVTALPDHVAQTQGTVKFEYLVALPDKQPPITLATVKTSHPSVRATIVRRSDQECSVVGECDLRERQIGPFKSDLEVEIQTTTGARMHGEFTIFTEVTGPVSISPPSLYYGVLERQTTSEFELTVTPDAAHSIHSCEVVSSDTQFLRVIASPSDKSRAYLVKCTIRSGSRIGPKNGHLTVRVKADRTFVIDVPFYGFIQK